MISASDLVELARTHDIMIATAESCTGGMISASLTEIPGASDVFDCGFATYSNSAKTALLGVSPETLDTYGAVSEEVASEMAEGALLRSHAQIAVSVTGIAGPGGSEHKPEGRVCFGLAHQGQKTHTQTIDFGALGRAEVRAETVYVALELIAQSLKTHNGL